MFRALVMLLLSLFWIGVWWYGLREGIPWVYLVAAVLVAGTSLIDAVLYFKQWLGRRRRVVFPKFDHTNNPKYIFITEETEP
jgi:hypothetical protein